MTHPRSPDKKVPAVIIVGAGLGGLMLAILLEQINIPYHIFERATKVRPLGSAMTLGHGILPVFEQLGLLEELNKMSLPCPSLDSFLYREEITKLGSVNLRNHKNETGYDHLIFPRPELYDLMLRQVPTDRITMNKKVLSTEEKDGKVFIHCSDNTSYEGDILVGADGAYSGVRQSLYKRMDDEGILPKEDLENFSIGRIGMVGVAKVENPEKFSQLTDGVCHFSSILGEGGRGRGWSLVSVPNNQVCWGIRIELSQDQAREQQFRNSEWGPESNDAMIKEFENNPTPWGCTMGEIMHLTPKDLISKFFLEEKVFKTWYHGRTVLIGDVSNLDLSYEVAAHKMLPSAGQGAVNAMQDAVVLANAIFNMADASQKSITGAFEDYYKQRWSRSQAQSELSKSMSKIMNGHTFTERVLRYVVFNWVPEWLKQISAAKSFALDYRPQIAWLPLAQNRGTVRLLPQECKRPDDQNRTAKVV